MAWLRALGRFYDLRSAIIGALLMGTIVALVNASHGWTAALVAATKQGLYTLIIAGLILRLCERIAVSLQPTRVAVLVSTLVSSLVTVGATTLLHHLRGTPEPWASVVPTLLLGPPSFVAWALRSRRAAAKSGLPTAP